MHTDAVSFSRILVLVCLSVVAESAAAQGGCGASGSNNASCTPPTPYISNVSIGSLNNSSGCSVPPAYSDFTALPGPTLPRLFPTPIVVTVSSSFGGGFCNVYCAWSATCPYDSVYVLSGVGSGTTVFTGTITPPVGAMASAKMRIVFRPFFPPNSIGTGDMGETEDYAVNTASLMSVVWSSPLGAGSIQFDINDGPPSGFYFHAIALAQGSTPNGPFFGLDIAFAELIAEFNAGFPFFGSLDPAGHITVGPIMGVPPGLQVWSVVLGFTSPPPVTPSDVSPTASWVTP
jgi:hypothetical protein